ncbi:MAG: tetratricopeptide repeat protein [Anaerolineae bacterium]
MEQLPTGTVVFLFTDIEGSSRLWEADAEAMRRAVARHDELLRTAIESNGGVVFKTVGDGFRAAFSSPRAAIAAAVRAQQDIGREDWPASVPIRVRIAVNCGAADFRDGDYFGPTLNRCARIEDLTHGGQVLISQSCYALTRDDLPEGVSLEYLGECALRDLSRPEPVYQLEHASLASRFPPPRTLDRLPTNLPIRLTRFIGRESELDVVGRLVRESRLVTLVGAGGTGKTRLALQAAADVMVHWPDGAWLVDLAPLAEPDQVYPAVAAVLGIREEQGRPTAGAVIDALRRRNLLLILDNCEHLIAECARMADDILTSCAGVTMLATSREALGIAGESCFRVPPLTTPPSTNGGAAVDLAQYEAVQLFVDRAQEVATGFELRDDNMAAIAEICSRLDGIPLALELAAARLAGLSANQVAQRLDQRFQLLTGGSRVALPRQQTLRAAVDWSYDLLDVRERTVLARLSVFASGCTLEAAESVCAGGAVARDDVMDLVLQLAGKSMVSVARGQHGTRYNLTQTMRDYAAEKLLQSGEVEAVRSRHLEHFAREVDSAERLPDGPELATRLDRLDAEYDNVTAALRWAALRGDATAGLRIAVGMTRYWLIRGHWSEGRAQLERAWGDVTESVSPMLRAEALDAKGSLAWRQGDTEVAKACYAEALEASRDLGDDRGIAVALNGLANIAYGVGDLDRAVPLYEESLAHARAAGDTVFVGGVLGNLGNVALRRGRLDEARARHEESLSIRRRMGDLRGAASALVNLGNVSFYRGDAEYARQCHEESLAIRRGLGDMSGMATSLLNLGTTVSALGDKDRARSLARESLAINRSLHDPVGTAFSLCNLAEAELDIGEVGQASSHLAESLRVASDSRDPRIVGPALTSLARVALERGDHRLAARFVAAAEVQAAGAGAPTAPAVRTVAIEILAACREVLSPDELAEVSDADSAMSLDEAVRTADKLADLQRRSAADAAGAAETGGHDGAS